jgi:hypothetical protein
MSDPISKHLAGFLRAIHRDNDVDAARGHIAGAMAEISERDRFAAHVLALGGDVEAAAAEADRIALTTVATHEQAYRIVLERIMRGEPITRSE